MARRARETLRAWRRAAGPWAPWVWPTLLTAPPSFREADDGGAESLAATWVEEFRAALAEDSGPAGQVWRTGTVLALADLPALVALASAPCLARHGIRPVAVLRRWPSPRGLLPSSPVVDAYYRYASQLRVRGRPRGAVWLVESERLLEAPTSVQAPLPLRTHLDNRYALDAQDLPAAARLGSAGVSTALLIVAPGKPPAPDLVDYARRLVAQGVPVLVLPLEALSQVGTQPRADAPLGAPGQ